MISGHNYFSLVRQKIETLNKENLNLKKNQPKSLDNFFEHTDQQIITLNEKFTVENNKSKITKEEKKDQQKIYPENSENEIKELRIKLEKIKKENDELKAKMESVERENIRAQEKSKILEQKRKRLMNLILYNKKL